MEDRRVRFANLWPARGLLRRMVPVVHAEDWDKIDPEIGDKYKALYAPVPGETGWDRVKNIFTTDAWGKKHPDFEFAVQGIMVSCFVGAGIGGVIGARQATEDFIHRNEATKFYTDFDARRRMNDHVFYSTCRSAYKWAWRTSLFTGVFIFSQVLLSSYSNTTTILHYVGAGALAGSLYKFRLGPRAVLVGGAVGSVLGLFAGTATTVALWLSGSSLEQMHQWRIEHRSLVESNMHRRQLKKRLKSLDENPLAQHEHLMSGKQANPDTVNDSSRSA